MGWLRLIDQRWGLSKTEILLTLTHDQEVDAWVRGRAAEELGELGQADEKMIQGLLGLARDEQVDAEVRCAAASALGELGHAEEVSEILLELTRDEEVDTEVHHAAYWSLKTLLGMATD